MSDIRVVEFTVPIAGSPQVVTAKRVGSSWQVSWPGRDKDSSGLVNCSQSEAERIAGEVAVMVADLEPLRAELKRRQDDIGEFVAAQQEELMADAS